MKYPSLGALPEGGGTRFRVWASKHRRVELLLEPGREPVEMTPAGGGVFETFRPGVGAGARYRYRLDGRDVFPDPASRFQPEGVHGPSEVVDPSRYRWRDGGWAGLDPRELVLYELHVGTFTPEGTYAALRDRLPYLKELGVTAVELMPVADFPGRWNWGYDHAALFAPSRAYGTPDELRALVDEAHRLGLAMVLDVIYNHFGPDGAYAAAFGDFFTERHHTPWGNAINLDDRGSEHVRTFLLENALHWLVEYHFDGLRLDATFALQDDSPKHFLAELAETVHALDGPRRFLIAEDYRNYNRLVLGPEREGYGLDGVWSDDFHHQMRNYLAGDEEGYYRPFAGTSTAQLAETLRRGWFFTGDPLPGTNERRGTSPEGIPPERFVLCLQNHDQVGNRPLGNRLTDDASLAAYRAASALILFAPQTPLLFMGQEWATRTPFQFFTDHNEELGRLVREGRREEFRDFPGFSGAEVPDPQSPDTFQRSKLDWSEADLPEHAGMLRLYRDLLALRPRLEESFTVDSPVEGGLVLRRGEHLLLAALRPGIRLPCPDDAELVLHTEEARYAPDGLAPERTGDAFHFPTPAAMVVVSGVGNRESGIGAE